MCIRDSINAASDLKTLKRLNVKAVLTVAAGAGLNYDTSKIAHKVIDADDTYTFDLSEFFEETFDFIETQRKAQKNVLVHCFAGVSRSSTIVIAYLMKKKKMTFEKAFAFVKQKRFLASPNLGFAKQLKDYEKKVGPSAP
eukprot:TRINITY_DN10030_c0_g1_i3.p1 TRINITY_DN10030_c0_g1~~TRINITY_DN10030_c0_g1_i3.p1  ORF type:complete len:140 (+),score=39.09 TRINITY_DN10030_c0_g1_i3:64-483(+)